MGAFVNVRMKNIKALIDDGDEVTLGRCDRTHPVLPPMVTMRWPCSSCAMVRRDEINDPQRAWRLVKGGRQTAH